MNKIIVMCGLQASGKSTIAEQLCKDLEDSVIVSSDALRLEYPELDNDKIFDKYYNLINEYLKNGYNVIADATNINIKMRKGIFTRIKEPCYKEIYIVNTPINLCKERLLERNNSDYPNKIPESVIDKYVGMFEIPFYEEGWDNIRVLNKPELEESNLALNNLYKLSNGYNQDTAYHNETLDKHMDTVYQYLKYKNMFYEDDYKLILDAALWHDIGKLCTRSVSDKDGRVHYYGHANYGAYMLLSCAGVYENDVYKTDDTLEWLFYINYHMIMHNINSDKSMKKWLFLFGVKKYSLLEKFNEADKYRKEII